MFGSHTGILWAGRQRRVQKIIARLRRDGYASPRELATDLETCAKTIQRDLEFMRDEQHCPVEYDPHEKAWHLTDKSFNVPLAFVSKQNLQAILVLGELISQYAGTPLGDTMQQAFEQVMQQLFADNKEDVDKVRAFAGRVRFVSAPPARIDVDVWQAIIRALQMDLRLEIAYATGGSGKPALRRFYPYGLIVRNRDWFLYGYCHKHEKPLTLFVPYIKQAKVQEDDYFELPPAFDLHEYTRKGFMGLQGEHHPTRTVILRFESDVAGAAETAPFARDQKTVIEPSGHLRVTFRTNALFQLGREVLRWGEAVTVVEPAQLRNEIVRTARGILGNYRRAGRAR
jgi:predicted DNA-binding transcriptional regulator YafY